MVSRLRVRLVTAIVTLIIVPVFMTTNGEVIYDSLCIRDSEYILCYASHCGGDAVYAHHYDAQAGDDFRVDRAVYVTQIITDVVALLGMAPEAVNIQLFDAGSDCSRTLARNPLVVSVVQNDEIGVENFDDKWGGYGQRITVGLREPLFLPGGHWYLSSQVYSADMSGPIAYNGYPDCFDVECDAVYRNGGDANTWCDGENFYYGDDDFEWHTSGQFEPISLAMRIEGVPAGDCGIGGALSAKCKAGRGKVVAKVKGASGGGVLTCWLEATSGPRQDMTITPDGKGKTVFRNVAPGEHTVTVCGQTVSLMCGP